MTEVYHFKSLSGRAFVAVFQDRYLNAASNKYAERYAAGLELSHHPLPTTHWRGRYDCLVNALIEHKERSWP